MVTSDWWPVTRAGVGPLGSGGAPAPVMGMPLVIAMQSTQAPHALLALQAKLAGMASLGRLVADGCVVRHGPPKDSGPAPSAGSGQALRQAQDRLTTNGVGLTIGSGLVWAGRGCPEEAGYKPAPTPGMDADGGELGALSAGGVGRMWAGSGVATAVRGCLG